ncbi:hypothetical protein ACWDYH_35615 [Nocardia goodfellowii]
MALQAEEFVLRNLTDQIEAVTAVITVITDALTSMPAQERERIHDARPRAAPNPCRGRAQSAALERRRAHFSDALPPILCVYSTLGKRRAVV